jgi:transposase
MTFTHFAGIDLGKFEACLSILGATDAAAGKAETFSTDVQGISAMLCRLRAAGDAQAMLVLLENTGKYCERVVAALHGEGFFVWLCPPTVIAKGTLGLNRLKDDAHDARQLALVARTYQAQALRWEPLSPDLDRLARLWSRRRQVVRDKVRVQNQRSSELDGLRPDPFVLAQMDAQLMLIESQEQEVDKAIGEVLRLSPGLRRKAEIITSVPGAGPQLARLMLAITAGFKRIRDAKSFAAHICTAPYAKSSGTTGRKARKVSKKGDRRAKALFYLGITSTATRKGGFWREEYLRMIESGRHHNSAINAIINKVIRLLFRLIETDQLFDPAKYRENKRSALDKKLQLS